MEIYEVFQRRTSDDPLVQVGSIKAPDLEMAMLLARETHFRHGEGAECWIARRADLHPAKHLDVAGVGTDRSYRRQDGYIGVGAKLKRIREALRAQGRVIEGARPGRSRDEH